MVARELLQLLLMSPYKAKKSECGDNGSSWVFPFLSPKKLLNKPPSLGPSLKEKKTRLSFLSSGPILIA